VRKAPKGVRIGIIVSRFNEDITGQLFSGAMARLREAGLRDADVDVVHVPGAFEIPIAAQAMGGSGRVRAIVCLGCVIRGETPHFEYISSACAHGIVDAALGTGIPMAFGVLTTNTVEEAAERAAPGPSNKGREAADAAVEMAGVVQQLRARRR
jgi:6,7-dimethyl-8-ribityllumazine synthase